MTRPEIREIDGMTDAIENAVMKLYGKTSKSNKTALDEAEKALETAERNLTDAEERAKEANDTLKTFTKENGDFKAKFEAEKERANKLETEKAELVTTHEAAIAEKDTAFNEYKAGIDTEKSNATTDKDVAAALKAAGYNPEMIDIYMDSPSYDRTGVKRDKEGKFSNADKFIEGVKADAKFGKFFGEQKKDPAPIGDAPPGSGGDGGKPEPKTLQEALEQKYVKKE